MRTFPVPPSPRIEPNWIHQSVPELTEALEVSVMSHPATEQPDDPRVIVYLFV